MDQVKKYEEKTFEDIKHINEYGNEYWEARELQIVLEYTQWRNFELVINKAKESCENSKNNISDHFADVSKMINLGKGAQKKVNDYHPYPYFTTKQKQPHRGWWMKFISFFFYTSFPIFL